MVGVITGSISVAHLFCRDVETPEMPAVCGHFWRDPGCTVSERSSRPYSPFSLHRRNSCSWHVSRSSALPTPKVGATAPPARPRISKADSVPPKVQYEFSSAALIPAINIMNDEPTTPEHAARTPTFEQRRTTAREQQPQVPLRIAPSAPARSSWACVTMSVTTGRIPI